MHVDIIDLGCGNISSIEHWIESANISSRVVSNAEDLGESMIVLPGVGAAGYYMNQLRSRNFDKAIYTHLEKGGRIIGICLGFQAMSDFCEEDNGHAGLGLIKGCVKKLNCMHSHNQWQPITLRKNELESQSFHSQASLTKKRVLNGRVFYNHEYGFLASDKRAYSHPIGNQLNQYSALIVKDRIIGMQFHPEKSQATGLDLIKMIL